MQSGKPNFSKSAAQATASLLAGLAVIAVAGLLVFVLTPALFAPPRSDGFGPISAERARHDVRTSALQLLAGVVLAAGAVFTARTVRLTRESNRMQRESQITDRYARSVELLGHAQAPVRVGGIYALERIAADSPERDHATIMDLLAAYAREYGRGANWKEPAQPEVEAAVVVLGRRDRRNDAPGFRPVLDGVSLANGRLRHLDLRDARLRDANLAGALLDGACLAGARLEKAQLAAAQLPGADLRGAKLSHADLTGAQYDAATLWPDGFDPETAGAVRV